MRIAAKCYIAAVVAAGGVVLVGSLAQWSSSEPRAWLAYLLVTALVSVVKLRLPGTSGTYSLNFLCILFGLARFTLAETLVAGCVGAVVQSLLNTRKRPQPIQLVFNVANLVLSVALCFSAAQMLHPLGLNRTQPALLAILSGLYFVVNTSLVSGVVALLGRAGLGEASGQWYLWPLPCHLVGTALVGLIAFPGGARYGEAWLILVPLVYLIHFFLGLLELPPLGVTDEAGSRNNGLTDGARLYLLGMLLAGLSLVVLAVFEWHSQNPARFAGYLALAVAASMFKVKLPGMTGTISLNFILLLVAIAQLTFSEAVLMAAVAGVVQCVWKPKNRPTTVQVLFNLACLSISTAFGYLFCRWAMGTWLASSLVGLLIPATLLLYSSNTILVATVLCLVEGKPLPRIWQNCYFWSFPYYLVGAAAAGLMIETSRSVGWGVSLLVLPLAALVYISYRAHISRAIHPQEARLQAAPPVGH